MVTGKNLIGNATSANGSATFTRSLQLNNEATDLVFHEANSEELELAVSKAEAAAMPYKKLSDTERASFLERIADDILAAKAELVPIAMQESNLPQARLEGEIGRTVGQLKMFATLLREGSWVNAIIDTAQPDRLPLPKVDLRQMQIPIGPVAVFGASNFPFAFSVAGGDTASALAAGCPVICKAHPGHPATSELVGNILIKAAHATNMPEGVFSLLQGESHESGRALVMHSKIKAVGFTGSFRGGKALFDAAASREEPIPVYAEMGSINPVFILPGKLAKDPSGLAQTLVNSGVMSVGQFCTNPGLILLLKSPETDAFEAATVTAISEAMGGKMLNEGIYNAYCKGMDLLKKEQYVTHLGAGKNGVENAAVPHAFSVSGSAFLANKNFSEEYFGPSAIHVIAKDKAQLKEIAHSLHGQLTTSFWADENDCEAFAGLINYMQNKAGRLMMNNVPTGVEVTHAMVHGGPFPATTDAKTTSVGTQAIYRFTRPVCFQNFPEIMLPDALKNGNPLKIGRMVNGAYSTEAI